MQSFSLFDILGKLTHRENTYLILQQVRVRNDTEGTWLIIPQPSQTTEATYTFQDTFYNHTGLCKVTEL